ncbi:MAG: hypothetical protein RBS99_19710 [Rhodospirillales bacterium]|nr:hypothetical protein [Rhodospirillales bacterium]
MAHEQAGIIHVNVTDFAASVAIRKDPSLAGRPFVLARQGSARPIVIAVSPKARQEGLYGGMSLATAIRMVPSLTIVGPDASAHAKADAALAEIASQYSPAIQADPGGHLFLDMSGTSRLFGPPVDCAVRIRNRIHELLGMEGAVAVASNKLVAKVGTRAIRPSGITRVECGDEASFLARQDIALLPGVGASIGRLLQVAGFHEIGQVAELEDSQVVALLGKRGIALRNAARGQERSGVDSRSFDKRSIGKRVDFSEPAFDTHAIKAALIAAAEDAGLEMRKELLASAFVHITLFWADGASTEGTCRTRSPLLLDAELIEGAWTAMERAMQRRVRIRGFLLSLRNLTPAIREPDLFTPEGPTREQRLQMAVDSTRFRYGPVALTHAAAVFHA